MNATRLSYGLLVAVVAAALGTTIGGGAARSARASRGTADGAWPSYAGDNRNHHYSPLAQIDAANFSTLEVAWRLKTDSFGPRPEFKLEGTPLVVDGMLYTTAGTRRAVIAVDAATGELRWVSSEREGKRAAASPRQLSGRGVGYWSDGVAPRIFYVTTGYQLVALDARSGSRIGTFGRGGIVDLKQGVVGANGRQIDLESGEIGLHSAPTVAGDVVLVGSSFREGHTPRSASNTKGLVHAFDARSGRRLWAFNTIPGPGEFGNDSWLNDSWRTTGNVGVWNQLAVDEDLGVAYLPVETPTSDFYGGHRPGNNLFAESLVAVDLRTGRRKWHYQLVHHPIWNMDIAAAPILADIRVDNRPIKAVAVMGKQAMVYVFDRVTGQPVWPIEERPVPAGRVPGEWYAPTQPFPTKPKPYDYQGVESKDFIDFTPELRAEAERVSSKFQLGPIFTPAVESRAQGPIHAFRSAGGTNWPGAAYDPETHTLIVPSYTSFVPYGLMPSPDPSFSDLRYVSGNAITGVRYIGGPGEDAGAEAPAATAVSEFGGSERLIDVDFRPRGLPLLKPPYGRITAIDLDTGDIRWQVPHGETPDAVRNHPALRGVDLPRTGQSGAVGALVTKTLIVVGDPLTNAIPGRGRGAMLRAYDKATGREVGSIYLPAPQSGTPMTYQIDGRQHIVVAVSGGAYSGEYLAFRLPS
ncbi:MAG: PQQ-binding-like beta-propeller repeat protein [Vicinamibacterales bacterium]